MKIDATKTGEPISKYIYGQFIEQNEAVGHAVRASYMYCGMADARTTISVRRTQLIQLSRTANMGTLGVRGRNSDNRLIAEKLGWKPTMSLRTGMEKTYRWIEEQVRKY